MQNNPETRKVIKPLPREQTTEDRMRARRESLQHDSKVARNMLVASWIVFGVLILISIVLSKPNAYELIMSSFYTALAISVGAIIWGHLINWKISRLAHPPKTEKLPLDVSPLPAENAST